MRGCALEEDDGAADDDISSCSNLWRRFCASKWCMRENSTIGKKTPPFSMEMDMRDHHYIAIQKKEEERERERVKEEGELGEYSI